MDLEKKNVFLFISVQLVVFRIILLITYYVGILLSQRYTVLYITIIINNIIFAHDIRTYTYLYIH